MVHKYWDREDHPQTEGYASYVVYRYADLLLMAAEAENEASGPSSAVYNNISTLRQRPSVNLPAVSAVTHPSQTDVRQLIRDERAIELGYEGKRYWDTRRWGIAEDVLNKSYNSLNISSFNPDGTVNSYMEEIYVPNDINDPTSEALFPIPDGISGGRFLGQYHFTSKEYVWPIPDGILANSSAIEQHPLWK